jgi:urease accessory protein
MGMGMDSPRSATPQSAAALLRLLQLVSPALPVGAYNFSQGLEYAVEAGWVHDEASALEWISGLAAHSIGTFDIPVLVRLYASWESADDGAVRRWNALLLASRETAELRAEERHMGSALAKILFQAGLDEAEPWRQNGQASFAALFALAACRWSIPVGDAACGYLWAWAENQVLGAVKLVPLGQSAGQRLLGTVGALIPGIVGRGSLLCDADIAVSSPGLAYASARHETQYSRLFRS